nr:glycosyltransferase family 2 protein [Lysinibacter cavernae]
MTFLLELKRLLSDGSFALYFYIVVVIWMVWGTKAVISAKYRPYSTPFEGTVSVIIPVVDEPVDLFREVLDRIRKQQPDEIIVVINGAKNPALEAVCDELGIEHVHTSTPGKRNALREGVAVSSGEIAVLVDSDTVWTANTLDELLKPFADATIGGVTTNQRVLDPARNVLTRWANWMESVRSEYSMPAMSRLGTVGCLPGRTIAFRRSILVRNMDRFMNETFLGVFLEVSDDRTLTNYTLKDGYKTVYQSTSVVYTDAPTEFRVLAKQQFRWARGSQYNTLRMSWWMLRNAPMLAFFYLTDIIVPFLILGCVTSWLIVPFIAKDTNLYEEFLLPAHGAGLVFLLGLAILMTVLSLVLRYSRHFGRQPADISLIPLFLLLNTFVLIPIRVWGFFQCARNAGWGTRNGGFRGEQQRGLGLYVPMVLGGLLLLASIALAVLPDRTLI